MPAAPHSQGVSCTPRGDYSSEFYITPVLDEHAALARSFNILDTSPSALLFSHADAPLKVAFAVLNYGGSNKSHIHLFRHCFAIAILYSHAVMCVSEL